MAAVILHLVQLKGQLLLLEMVAQLNARCLQEAISKVAIAFLSTTVGPRASQCRCA